MLATGTVDWSITHAFNAFLVTHDAIEDPLSVYIHASEALFLGMLIVVCLLARHVRAAQVRRAAVAAGLSAGLGLLIGKIITEFYVRPRPFVAHPSADHLFVPHPADASFPSDHATATIAIATAILLRHRERWGTITLIFAIIVCIGRVALGLHYPSDVVGGAALGAAAALVLWIQPLRHWIDVISDRAGGVWDHGSDVVLARSRAPLVHASRRGGPAERDRHTSDDR